MSVVGNVLLVFGKWFDLIVVEEFLGMPLMGPGQQNVLQLYS